MKNNDLSSRPVPKIALVFEGALAWLLNDPRARKEFTKRMDRGQWDDAVSMFEFNELMETVIWDRCIKYSVTLDVITYLGPDEWAAAVAKRIGQEELPVRKVWATTPQLLGRKLAYMPDLVRVYDPFQEHQLMYGSKGRYITNPNQLGY